MVAPLEDERDTKEVVDSAPDSEFVDGISTPVTKSELLLMPNLIGNSSNSIECSPLAASTDCIKALDTPPKIKYNEQDNSENNATKVFDINPQRNNRVKTAVQVFHDIYQTRTAIKYDSPKANGGDKAAENTFKNNVAGFVTFGGETLDPVAATIEIVPLRRGLTTSILCNLVIFDTANFLGSGLGKSNCHIASTCPSQSFFTQFPFDPGANQMLVKLTWGIFDNVHVFNRILQHARIKIHFATAVNSFTVVHGGTKTVIYVWNPENCYLFVALPGYPMHLTTKQLLGSLTTFFLVMYSNSQIKVWDPGWQWSVYVYISQFNSTLLEKCGLKVMAEEFGSYLTEYCFKRMPKARYYDGLWKFDRDLWSQHDLNAYLHKWLDTGQRFKVSNFCLALFRCTLTDVYVYAKSSWLDVESCADELVDTNFLAVLEPSALAYLCHGEKYNLGYLKHCDNAIQRENYYFREVSAFLSVDCIRELEFDVVFLKSWMELYLLFVTIGVVSGQSTKSMLALEFSEPDEQIHSNSFPARKDDASLVVANSMARLLELITTELAFTLNFISLAVHGGYQYIIELNTQFIMLQELPGPLLKKVTVEMIRAEYITKARPMLLFAIVLLWQLTHSKGIWTLIHTGNAYNIQYVISVVVLSMTRVWNSTFNFAKVEVANAHHQMLFIDGESIIMNGPEPILSNGPMVPILSNGPMVELHRSLKKKQLYSGYI